MHGAAKRNFSQCTVQHCTQFKSNCVSHKNTQNTFPAVWWVCDRVVGIPDYTKHYIYYSIAYIHSPKILSHPESHRTLTLTRSRTPFSIFLALFSYFNLYYLEWSRKQLLNIHVVVIFHFSYFQCFIFFFACFFIHSSKRIKWAHFESSLILSLSMCMSVCVNVWGCEKFSTIFMRFYWCAVVRKAANCCMNFSNENFIFHE